MSIESTVTRRVTSVVESCPEKKFVPRLLPWLLAGAALLVYLLSLSHWISTRSLEPVVMISGWNSQPELTRPLFWLVTYPFRLLPPVWLPIALNLFSAVCGALTLALLARSVALLPHDRTEQQRLREPSAFSLLSIRSAWVPPVIAVLFCGLQLSFWENATAASNEIFDLLIFAYLVRCLLEFRLYGADSWMLRAGFVFGASMTNNWAMIAFFPLFLGALIWTKGVGFFNLRFLRQMFLLGTAGLLFYLVLPTVASVTTQDVGFWPALKWNLGYQKNWLTILFSKYWLFQSTNPLWILALFSLMPLLAIAIRSPAYFGDPSKIGVFLANFVFQVLYAAFFLLCTWVFLDPPLSPRNYAAVTALPLYYLAALSVGYFSGYFLLVFGGAKPMLRNRPLADYPTVLNLAVTGCVGFICLVPLALLVYRNLPQIRLTNGPGLRQYSESIAKNIPRERTVVLSDDPARLFLFQAISAELPRKTGPIVLDTSRLPMPSYHFFLSRFYAGRWTNVFSPKRKDQIENMTLQKLVVGLSASNSLYYLHPSFGYYFERFYAEPHGLNFRLVPFPTNTIAKPSLTPALIAENQTFWEQNAATVTMLTNAIAVPPRSKDEDLFKRFAHKLYLPNNPNLDATSLAMSYSRALTSWGVELQRNDQLEPANTCFRHARDLKPDNVAAEINLQANAKLREHQKTLQLSASIEAQVGKYLNVQNLLNANGPVDEASLCFDLGNEFFEGQNFRQAAHEFDRVASLTEENSPEFFRAKVAFGNSCLYAGFPDDALNTSSRLRNLPLGSARTNAPALLRLEAFALLFKNQVAAAQKAVENTLTRFPDDESLLAMVTSFYLNLGEGFETNALRTIDQQLTIRPENTSALVNKGLVWLRLGNYTNSLPPLTEVIESGVNASSETNIYYAALYNRGLAYWKSEELGQAAKDFEEFHAAYPDRPEICYMLGEIAYSKKDTNVAIINFQKYLASTPPTTALETSNALVKLKELQRIVRQ